MMQAVMEAMPIVAILRGVKPDEVQAVGEVLYESGVRCIEVPLNSPSPLKSIAALAKSMPDDCLVGAGTVLKPEAVRDVADAGGKLIVTPNTSQAVIREAIAKDMVVAPGVATPTEAFEAVDAGARWLKLFPASTYGPGHVKAMLAVLPAEVRFLAVGGIGPDDFATWQAAGVKGFGIGSELYRAGDNLDTVRRKIEAITAAI